MPNGWRSVPTGACLDAGAGLNMATGTGKILTILLGAAAVVAVAGGGAYYFFDRVSGEPVKIIELINKPYTLAQTADVLDQPKSDGKFLIRIRQGGSVTVLGVVDGGAWLQIALPKDQEGYIPSVTIPEISSDGTPKPPPCRTKAAQPVSAALSCVAAPPTHHRPQPRSLRPRRRLPPMTGRGAASCPTLIDFLSVDQQQVSAAQPTGCTWPRTNTRRRPWSPSLETKVEIGRNLGKDGNEGWLSSATGRRPISSSSPGLDPSESSGPGSFSTVSTPNPSGFGKLIGSAPPTRGWRSLEKRGALGPNKLERGQLPATNFQRVRVVAREGRAGFRHCAVAHAAGRLSKSAAILRGLPGAASRHGVKVAAIACCAIGAAWPAEALSAAALAAAAFAAAALSAAMPASASATWRPCASICL